MIRVTVYKNPNKEYIGFKTEGHAEYADSGQDIVCSAVSVLVINTINSIDTFTTDECIVKSEQESGVIACRFSSTVSEQSNLLLDSLILGLQGIQKNYQSYIEISFKEV